MKLIRLFGMPVIFLDLLEELYDRTKHFLFLIISIILLMVGFVIKYFPLIILSILSLIISIGALRHKMEEKEDGKKVHKTGKDKLVEPKKTG